MSQLSRPGLVVFMFGEELANTERSFKNRGGTLPIKILSVSIPTAVSLEMIKMTEIPVFFSVALNICAYTKEEP